MSPSYLLFNQPETPKPGNQYLLMMHHLINIFFLLCCGVVSQAQNDFASADSLARHIAKDKYKTPDLLARSLCKDLKTDAEKARALFTWTALHIKYDFSDADRDNPQFDSEEDMLKYREKMIQKTYQRGKGICMDYSRLYQKMAQTVGLECEYIGGHSKNFGGHWEKHAWNAVKIDGAWQLLDATWGAGGSEDGKKFDQEFKPGYFFTPPRLFALNHFPDDEHWQLLETPVTKKDFKNQAEISYGNPDQGITDMSPFGQPLTKGAGGKTELRLKIKQPPSMLRLTMGSKILIAEQTEKEGWITLTFVPGPGRELKVWSAEKTGDRVSGTLLGVFPVQ